MRRDVKKKTKVVPADEVLEKRVKHFLAKIDMKLVREEQICSFMKMTKEERDEYARGGDVQSEFVVCLNNIEKQMVQHESQEREDSKEKTVLRLISQPRKNMPKQTNVTSDHQEEFVTICP